MLTARVAAVNGGDPAEIAKYYATDATVTELDQDPPNVTEGKALISEHIHYYQKDGFRLQQTGGATIAIGPFVAQPMLWSGKAGGIVVYQLNDDGTIAHSWVIGTSMPEMNGP